MEGGRECCKAEAGVTPVTLQKHRQEGNHSFFLLWCVPADWKERFYVLTCFIRPVHYLILMWGQEFGPQTYMPFTITMIFYCSYIFEVFFFLSFFVGLTQTINNRMWFLFVVSFQHLLWNVIVTPFPVYPNYCCRCTSEHNQLIKPCCSSV